MKYLGQKMIVALGLLMVGCGTVSPQAAWPINPIVQIKGRKTPPKRPMNAAAPIEAALQRRGFSFGTDGSVHALYSYATSRHRRIDAREARPGDILFFDTSEGGRDCGSHAGLVEGIAPGGALKFKERREGEERTSVVDPLRPAQRRDDNGRLINTFLRPMRPGDPEGTRYYAGQMVCDVIRVGR